MSLSVGGFTFLAPSTRRRRRGEGRSVCVSLKADKKGVGVYRCDHDDTYGAPYDGLSCWIPGGGRRFVVVVVVVQQKKKKRKRKERGERQAKHDDN